MKDGLERLKATRMVWKEGGSMKMGGNKNDGKMEGVKHGWYERSGKDDLRINKDV